MSAEIVDPRFEIGGVYPKDDFICRVKIIKAIVEFSGDHDTAAILYATEIEAWANNLPNGAQVVIEKGNDGVVYPMSLRWGTIALNGSVH